MEQTCLHRFRNVDTSNMDDKGITLGTIQTLLDRWEEERRACVYVGAVVRWKQCPWQILVPQSVPIPQRYHYGANALSLCCRYGSIIVNDHDDIKAMNQPFPLTVSCCRKVARAGGVCLSKQIWGCLLVVIVDLVPWAVPTSVC